MELTEKDFENIEAALEYIFDSLDELQIEDYDSMEKTFEKIKGRQT